MKQVESVVLSGALVRAVMLVALLLSGWSVSVHSAPEAAEQKTVVAEQFSVNVNSASAELIADTLTGVGLKKAQAIVDWREQHGDFTSLEQLLVIKGIGEATLAKNKARIKLN